MNTYVINITGEKQTLMLEINRHKLIYLGHIRHRDGNNLEKVIMESMVEGNCSRGQAARRWMDGVRLITGRLAAECSKLAMAHKGF